MSRWIASFWIPGLKSGSFQTLNRDGFIVPVLRKESLGPQYPPAETAGSARGSYSHPAHVLVVAEETGISGWESGLEALRHLEA